MKSFRLKNIIASILLVLSAVLFSFGLIFTQNQYTVKNSVTSVLSQDEPTDTSLYWTDESVIGEELLASGFTKGTGTAEDPYQISSAKELAYLSYTVYNNSGYNYSNVYFKQTANIDLSQYYWQPIGIRYDRSGATKSAYFSGNYDGGNFQITGIFTKSGSSNANSYQGLFGYIYAVSYNITIKNINVKDSNIQGYQYIAGIVGYGYKAASKSITIESCSYTGNIYGTSNYVAGIVSYIKSDSSSTIGSIAIKNCYSRANIKGGEYTAGIVGYLHNHYSTYTSCAGTITIANNYSTGDITGSRFYTAGIVSYTYSGNLNVYNNFNIGAISGSTYVGGILSYFSYNNYGWYYLTNNYNLNNVTGTSYVGAIIGGSNSNLDTFASNYYGVNCSSELGGAGVSGSSTGEVVTGATYKESLKIEDFKSKEFYLTYSNWSYSYPWDFNYVWGFEEGENDGYPVYVGKTVGDYWIEDETRMEAFTGSGTEEDPYTISTVKNLVYLSYMVYSGQGEHTGNYYYENAYFKQTADIDLSGYLWQPIGIRYDRNGSSKSAYFSGNYDGGNYTITGIETLASTTNAYSYQGLFGYIYAQNYDITIKNINIKDSNIQGYQYVAGIVGYGYKAASKSITIESCSYAGNIYGTSNYVAGIVGYMKSDSSSTMGSMIIKNCYSRANIKGGEYTAGIVGYLHNHYSTYTSCAGTITIANNYSTGDITGSRFYTAGIVSYTYSGNLNVYNNFNIGAISGSTYVGGILSYFSYNNYGWYYLTNNYNLNNVTGTSYVGAIIGGSNSNLDTFASNYYGVNCSSELGGAGVSGSSTGEVVTGATYKESLKIEDFKSKEFYLTYSNWSYSYPWDFNYVWGFEEGENDGYPVYVGKTVGDYWIEDETRMEAFTGSGTEEDPYTISTVKNLVYLSYMVYSGQGEHTGNYYYENAYFKQTADIDLSGYLWQPIGIRYDRNGSSKSAYFSGNYDGGNYTITGIETLASTTNAYSYQGLFGYIYAQNYDITIKNINIKDSNIQGYQYVAGIVGYGYKAAEKIIVIENCSCAGNIYGTSNYVAGIVGNISSGESSTIGSITIKNCYNRASIKGGEYTAGIVGYLRNYYSSYTTYKGTLNVNGNYNFGNVSGSNYISGIIGDTYCSFLYCQNNRNFGKISGNSYVAGFLGYGYNRSSSSQISYNINYGSIYGSNYVGGIVGYNSSINTISNCGVEANVYSGDTTNFGAISGGGNGASNCYAIGDMSAAKLFGGTSTSTNCVGVITVDGVENKVYKGSSFTAFVWINEDSSPVPKALVFMGSVTSNVTVALLQERGFVALS